MMRWLCAPLFALATLVASCIFFQPLVCKDNADCPAEQSCVKDVCSDDAGAAGGEGEGEGAAEGEGEGAGEGEGEGAAEGEGEGEGQVGVPDCSSLTDTACVDVGELCQVDVGACDDAESVVGCELTGLFNTAEQGYGSILFEVALQTFGQGSCASGETTVHLSATTLADVAEFDIDADHFLWLLESAMLSPLTCPVPLTETSGSDNGQVTTTEVCVLCVATDDLLPGKSIAVQLDHEDFNGQPSNVACTTVPQ